MLSGKSETTSPCNNGDPNGPKKGFACPHMMMFSTDMELAAKYDGLDQDFIYAVAGRNSDSDCGKCYQVGYKRRTKKREKVEKVSLASRTKRTKKRKKKTTATRRTRREKKRQKLSIK